MKIISVIMVICIIGAYSASLTNEQKVKLRKYIDNCVTEVGVDKAVINGILRGEQFHRNEKVNCFASCLLKKIGMLHDDGKLDEDLIRKKVADSNININQANAVMNKCKNLRGKDTCETGGLILDCFITHKTFSILK